MKVKELGRRFWLYLLKHQNESMHLAVGEANNNLLTDVFNSLGTKNTSLIIITFESVLACFDGLKDELALPYLSCQQQQTTLIL